MRITFLFAALFLLGFVQPARPTCNIKPLRAVSRTSTGLEIHKARLKGRKLIVTGINFDEGAVVLVNGELMKTIRDSDSATTRLVAKKAGDAIPLDTIYLVSAKNSTGEQESLKNFRGSLFNARVLPNRQEGYVHPHVDVDVGEYVLTTLAADLFDSAPVVRIDSDYLQRVTDFVLPSTEHRLYRAIQSSVTRFEVVIYYGGDLPPLQFYFVLITIA